MNPEPVIDIQSARKLIEEKQIQNVKVAVTDCDGVMRGKYIQKKKFDSALENGAFLSLMKSASLRTS